MADHDSKSTRDHDKIRQWTEARDGRPAVVSDTRSGDSALLRIDFPIDGVDEGLEVVAWDEFFDIFDRNGLTFLYQEKTENGETSRFNKFVDESR